MATLAERFARVVEAAQDDPDVVGLALYGSRGKGFATAESDYDAMVLLRDGVSAERRRNWIEQTDEDIELRVVTQGEFARYAASWGREFAWAEIWLERYCFTNSTAAGRQDRRAEHVDRLERERPGGTSPPPGA